MARLVIEEALEEGSTLGCLYDVYLDEKYVGIAGGDQIKFEMEIGLGKHSLYLKQNWTETERVFFDIEKNTNITFECGNDFKRWDILFRSFKKRGLIFLRRPGERKEEVSSTSVEDTSFDQIWRVCWMSFIFVTLVFSIIFGFSYGIRTGFISSVTLTTFIFIALQYRSFRIKKKLKSIGKR